jgi:SAM-dependent methyltransferase
MYKDTRPAAPAQATASTPEVWAERFADATTMNAWRAYRFSRTKEWALIRRYVPRGGAILDAGCGFGEWVSFLSAQGYRAVGLDYSEALIGRLRAAYPQHEWTLGDIRRMPYADGAFDAVISWGVIEHDEAGPGETLREFHRVLRPGGVIVVTVPVDSAVQRRSADYLHHRDGGHQVFFQYFMTEADLASEVRAAGFAIVDQGILPNAIIQLVSPRLSARLRGVAFRLVNLLVSSFMSWIPRYCVMRYAVAARPAPATQPGGSADPDAGRE